MKRFAIIVILSITAAILSACGDSSKVDTIIDSELNVSASSENSSESSDGSDTDSDAFSDRSVDIDLSAMSKTMVYSQVYDMMYTPDNYIGQSIKVKGPFSYVYDDEKGQEYFAVLITDAQACCSQGMEFVLDGEYSYPDDYPELDTEITVTGTFNSYQENGYTYCQLLNASMTY